MMNFEFKCPQCGQMVIADEAYRGQVAECPHCGKGIVVPRDRSKVQPERKNGSAHMQGQSHTPAGPNEKKSHKTVVDPPRVDPPRGISNKWVWCLAIIPLVVAWTLSLFVNSFVGYLAALILIIIFVILDFKEVKRSGQDVSKSVVLLALVFLPGYLFYREVKVPAIICCVLLVLAPIAGMLLPSIAEQQSVHESAESLSEDGEFRVIKNSAGEYDWQSMCQREWPKSFSEIQKAFSVFGGFQLAQQPVDGFNLEGGHSFINHVQLMVQKDVPLRKRYRYFQKADLTFFHGALVGFTLKAHFENKYSKASVDREYKVLQEDIFEKLKCLNTSELGVTFEADTNPLVKGLWVVKYGLPSKSGVHNLVGNIYTMHDLEEDHDFTKSSQNNGYNLTLSVNAHGEMGLDNIFPFGFNCEGLIKFIELVIAKEAYEAGEDLEGFEKKTEPRDNNLHGRQNQVQALDSDDRKAEVAETRSVRTGAPVPPPTISGPNKTDSSPNRTEEITDLQSQTTVRQPAENKTEDGEASSMQKEAPIPEPTEKGSPSKPSEESTDSQQKAVAPPNSHFEAARKHDWQSMCQKEWCKAFFEIQETLSVFGGFRLVQPPIDGVEFDTEDIQKDVPLLKQYRYFKKADMEFFNGALVGFTLKAHFAKSYSKASVEREYKALQDDVVKKIERLKRPELGIGLASTSTYFEYGQSRNPSVHKIVGRICISCDLRQDADGYDLTLNIDATRGLTRFMELTLKKEADEAGDELEEFDKKHPAKGEASHKDDNKQSPVERTSKPVKITGFGSYKFGQKYPAARMTADMWQEGGLAIKPVQSHYRKFRTLELGYAIDGKQLCQIKLCAEFPPNVDDSVLNKELMNVKGEIERQLECEMTESGDSAYYEDENYVVKLWHQATTKTVYKTRHVGFRNQRTASTVDVKGLYLLLEDKRLMPK